MNRIDTEGISDEIVVGVIEQLENTGNRPHLLKELAAVLGTKLPIVQRYDDSHTRTTQPKLVTNTCNSSANPSAIISSRLTNYIKRPWTALAPCPVGKELVGTHPKRIYFFLTTSPHQPIPDQDEMPPPAPVNRIISPSISSQADEEERDARTRSQMSPSPEVDLSTPELEDDDDPMSPAGSFFSGRNSISRETAPSNMSHSRRAQSPPLERDEREFTQTASSLQQQRRTQSKSPEVPPPAIEEPMADLPQQQPEEETEESAALRNSEAAAALFGHDPNSAKLLTVGSTPAIGSSPMIKPQQLDLHINTASKRGVDEMMEDVRIDSSIDGLTADWMWSELQSPENVDLEELDDLFADC